MEIKFILAINHPVKMPFAINNNKKKEIKSYAIWTLMLRFIK